MIRIILFYEHLTREWDSLQKVKMELERMENTVFIFSILYEKEKALKVAIKEKIDVIVVPWFVDESHEKKMYPFIKFNRKIKIINLHHEQIGSNATQTVFMPKTPYTANGSFHLVWGENFKECLENAQVESNRIYITGNIRTDSTKGVTIGRKELFLQYGIDDKKKCILFAENRGYYIQRISPDLRKELIHRGMTDDLIDARKEYEEKSLSLFLKDLNKLDSSFFDKYEVVYRPHPGTKPPEGIPTNIHVISERSIYDWIFACDLFLTNGSTSIFEAEMCAKPCAVCDTVEEPPLLKVQGLDNYIHIKSIECIDDKLFMKILHQSEKEKIYVRYSGVTDGLCCRRVADAVMQIANFKNTQELEQLSFSMAKPSRKERIREIVFEYITRFMVKTNFLYVFKFPRSAYGESGDIPYAKEASWTKKGVSDV